MHLRASIAADRGRAWLCSPALLALVLTTGACPYEGDSDGWRAAPLPDPSGCSAGDEQGCGCPDGGTGEQSCRDDGTWSACGGCAGEPGTGGGGATTSSGTADGDVCTNNGFPRCVLVFGDDACDACAHEACCSDIAACADDEACCGLAACYAQHCAGAADGEACIEASCSEYARSLWSNFLSITQGCLPDECPAECQ